MLKDENTRMLIQGFLRSIVIQVFIDENQLISYKIIISMLMSATAFACDKQY